MILYDSKKLAIVRIYRRSFYCDCWIWIIDRDLVADLPEGNSSFRTCEKRNRALHERRRKDTTFSMGQLNSEKPPIWAVLKIREDDGVDISPFS